MNKSVLILDGVVYYNESLVQIEKVEVKESRIPLPEAQKKRALKVLNPEVLNRLGGFLNKRFKNTSVRILSTSDIKEEYGEEYANSAGFVFNGVVVLNKDTASLSTAMHEFGHLYLAELKDIDIELYNRLMVLAAADPLMDEVRELYPNLSETDQAEEVFVELLGRTNASALEAELNDNTGKFGKVKRFFNSMFSKFLGRKEKPTLEFTLGDSLLDVLDKIGGDMMFNSNSGLHNLPGYKQKAMKGLGTQSMSQTAAVQLLTEQGYIREVCG